MSDMTPKDYEHLIALLDGRIDELTKPIPSRQILRFAKALQSAEIGDDDSVGTYGDEDYVNLQSTQDIVNETLPKILESIRAKSIHPEKGWRFDTVEAADGDHGLCAVCREPFQHFEHTVKVHCLDMHPNAYDGVCRGCVRQYAPLEFVETEGVGQWLTRNPRICASVETDYAREGQRIDLIDAIRRHAHSTHYFGNIVRSASEWAKRTFGEWR